MRTAFHPQKGPLTDMEALVPEREAVSSQFAGAVGRYRNPNVHRDLGLDHTEVQEIVMLASHLVRIVEARRLMRTQRRGGTVMAKVKVFFFTCFDVEFGTNKRSVRPATMDAIKSAGGVALPETMREVDATEIDGNGFRKTGLVDRRLQTTVWHMMRSAGNLNRHLANRLVISTSLVKLGVESQPAIHRRRTIACIKNQPMNRGECA